MEKTTFFIHSLISYDILTNMIQDPETYNTTSKSGLNQLKQLATHLACREVKSLRGAYEQSKLVGFCLASGWSYNNKDGIQSGNEKSIVELISLNSIIMADQSASTFSAKRKKAQTAFFANTTLNICITKGFQHGLRLGKQTKQTLQTNNIAFTIQNLMNTVLSLAANNRPTIKKVSVSNIAGQIQKNKYKARTIVSG